MDSEEDSLRSHLAVLQKRNMALVEANNLLKRRIEQLRWQMRIIAEVVSKEI
ncbi:MAG: hypothetical protein ACE5GN_03050 [Waddliaceae bacterium]